MNLRILIDFTQIPVKKTGIGVYALNLIEEIQKLDKENYYYVLLQNDEKVFDSIQSSKLKIIRVKAIIFRKLFLRFLLEQIYIPYLTLRYKIDITHSLHYSFPLFSFSKKIVTIPDLTFFKFPQYHILFKRYYFKTFIYLASVFADKIITISQSSLNDLIENLNIKRTKIKVIYLGVNSHFKPQINNDKITIIKNKYKINQDYILFLGTIEPRKNIINLIKAFDKFAKESTNYKLVIAGKLGWYYADIFQLINELSINEKVIFTGFIQEEDKPFLIAGAKIFIYPSIYEGFGIPVLEALSCGIPTITSNVSSLPEVAGDSALLINPLKIEDIFESMKKLLIDTPLYERLKTKSIEQAKKFSWENTALETIKAYNSLL